MTRTTLVPALCREVEVGDRVLWGGEVCEVVEVGPWEESAHPYIGTWRDLALRDPRGTDLEGRRVEYRGTILVSPQETTSSAEVEDQEPPA